MLLFYVIRMVADVNPAIGTDDLMFCWGQLIAKSLEQHLLCDGVEDNYAVGELVMEMEKCPHPGCGARFVMSPPRNLKYQDTIHRAILSYICGASRGCYVMEGTLICHIIKGHGGPAGFEADRNRKHSERYLSSIISPLLIFNFISCSLTAVIVFLALFFPL